MDDTSHGFRVHNYPFLADMNLLLRPKIWREIRNMSLLVVCYAAAARFGLMFALQPADVTVVWLPAGISLVAVLIFGNRMLIGVALGELWSALSVTISLPVAIGMGVGNTLEIFLCSYLVRRFINDRMEFSRLQDVARFVAVVLLSSTVGASFGTASLAVGGIVKQSLLVDVWLTWWLGDAGGIIIIAPMLMAWFRKGYSAEHRTAWWERMLFFVLVIAASVIIFNDVLPSIFNRSLPYSLMVFCIWSAFRFRQVETTMTNVLIAAIAIWSAARGTGPFIAETLNHTLLSLQMFLGMLSSAALVLSALVMQRRETEFMLRKMRDELEHRVQERTADLLRANIALSDDIAQRQEIEEKLKKSEEQYRLLTERSPDGMIVHTQGRVKLINPTALRIIGAETAEQMMEQSVLDFIPEDLKPIIIARMQKITAGESVPALEEQFIRLDGTLIDVEVVGIPFLYNTEPSIQLVFTDITERKRAEQKLRKSEATYKALVENSPDIIVRINKEYTIEYLHVPSLPEAHQAIGANTIVIAPEDFRVELQKALATVFASGKTVVYEAEGATPFDPQTKRSYVIYISAISDEHNEDENNDKSEVVSAYIVARDITSRKHVERSLVHERDLYEALVNSLPGIFYLFNEEGQFLRWNKNLELVSGYSADEIKHVKPSVFFGGSDAQELPHRVARVFEGNWVASDAKFITKDGRKIPYYFTGALIRIDGKRCLIGVGIDITERKQTEAQLRESEARLREAQRVAKVGNFEIDLRTRHWEASEEIFSILGIDEHYVRTTSGFADLVHPDFRERLNELFANAITQKTVFQWDYPIIHPNGTIVWTTGIGRAFYDDEGNPTIFRGTLQDITARKQIEESVRQYNEELELRVQQRTAELGVSMEKERRFNQSKTEFVSLLSHQFRTPLTIILSSSELLERMIKKSLDPMPPHIERHLNNISQQIKTMAEMLAGVSRLMNIQTTILREQAIPYDLVKFCTQTMREFTNRYPGEPQRRITFVANVETLSMPIQFSVLQTAVLEVMHNADTYSPRDRSITLELAANILPEPSHIQLRIRDEGKGIEEGEREAIFELFRRGTDEMEMGTSRGLGLGLTVAKMSVEAMGGRIWCDSSSSDGSIFIIELPVLAV